jgi:ribosomal RNA-processing protein 17
MSGRFLEEGAIAYRPAKDASIRTRVSKKHARNRDLEVVFDPSDHKEYLTGFHKRKQQRRKDALKQLEKRQKFQRLEDRAEKREAFKKQLGLEDQDLYNNNNNDGDDDDKEPEVRVFDAGNLVSTVTVCPLKTGDTSSEEEDNDNNNDDKKGDEKQYPEPVVKHQYAKMTKGALRALTKTSIKLGKVKKQPYANRKNPAAAAAASRKGGGGGRGDSGGRGGGGGGGGRRR